MVVEDVMTAPALSVTPATPIADAARLMLDHHISGLVVVEADGTLAGVVTEGDFLRRSELGTEKHRSWWQAFLTSPAKVAADYVHDNGRKVADVMTAKVVTTTPKAALADVVSQMMGHGVKRLPVVFNGKVVGVVSRADLLRTVIKALSQGDAAPCDDATIRNAIAAELNRQTWTASRFIKAQVTHGEVTLIGTVFNDEERRAATVIAENVPGVKSVEDKLVWIEPISGTVIPPAA